VLNIGEVCALFLARREIEELPLLFASILCTIPSVNRLEIEHPDLPDATEQLFASSVHAIQQIQLIGKYNDPNFVGQAGILTVLIGYPEIYLKQIDRLMHGRWYTACFMSSYKNPSAWIHYGGAHKGVCLKFKTNVIQGRQSINLHGIIGEGGSPGKTVLSYGNRDHEFHQVDYAKRYPEVDFFRSLGRLPGAALSFWYSDQQGKRSACLADIYADEEKWRKNYWDLFYKSITTKLNPWAYEGEYRLIISELMVDFSNKERRKLKYNFDDLEGLIFGSNTSEDVKLHVSKIIEEKCRMNGRKDFKFYQSYYATHTGEFEVVELTFMKFT
jgi:hypothetical protein